MNENKTNVLIAYFSHTGQNYANGSIVELKKGNTEVAAEMLAELTGGALFEIQAKKEYPFVYSECTDVAKQELGANARPELLAVTDVSGYDTLFLGFPCWWGTMPMPVWTFLTGQSFARKTIHPFCTHEGSGMGSSERDISALCPGAKVCAGLPIRGCSVSGARSAMEKWLKENRE